MKLISGAKYAALQTRCDRLAREAEAAEKHAADQQATIQRLRNQLDQQRDNKPDTPVQHPQRTAGAAELQRRLNLALRANGELAERLGQMQDSHIADTRELHDLRQAGGAS
ncbi:hypothetical protein QBA57_28765 [Streptomyces scabiei]|uniref:hypothetical protein n=1 Tax=Streptomyces scabiei TaxID=1930 RepID=UPI001B327A90|nr:MULTISPECIES: hypothetical protein [Streptomyces]MBP5883140.1 hypothetical protein [Streptomyces sp. LBUM 1487]MDX2628619.1 hypothetical protein [Streptomyces scabiei]MDX3162715.1 hypothetical protein [Streptomyces scabiei]